MRFQTFHRRIITSLIVLIGVLSFTCLTQVRSVQAVTAVEYAIETVSVAEGIMIGIIEVTGDKDTWTSNGSRVVVLTLGQKSRDNLLVLKDEISLNGEDASEGKVVASLAVLISWANTINKRSEGEPSGVDAVKFKLLSALVVGAMVEIKPSLADLLKGLFEGLGDVLGETHCADSIDNDNDGATDCADSECAILPLCTTPSTETSCSNQIDDDNDGLIDCLDVDDCANDPACAVTREVCDNNVDDDGDGLVDCCDVLDCDTEGCTRICGIDEIP